MEQGIIFELSKADIGSIINIVISWAMLSAGHYKILMGLRLVTVKVQNSYLFSMIKTISTYGL